VELLLTGEGIHTAMMGGQAAADTLLDMRSTGDFSKASTVVYQRRWMAKFGHDFPMSTKFAELIYR
jgi:flavin-dependent dehydrogenase